jgi:hypothetical protein
MPCVPLFMVRLSVSVQCISFCLSTKEHGPPNPSGARVFAGSKLDVLGAVVNQRVNFRPEPFMRPSRIPAGPADRPSPPPHRSCPVPCQTWCTSASAALVQRVRFGGDSGSAVVPGVSRSLRAICGEEPIARITCAIPSSAHPHLPFPLCLVLRDRNRRCASTVAPRLQCGCCSSSRYSMYPSSAPQW